MEYHEAVERLERLQRSRPKLGTATTAALLSSLDDPHADLTCVQVTGSNGKGSTARILASILDAAGRSVGLYTSPDLNDVRERITVSGRPIPKAAVTRFVGTVWPTVTAMSAADDAPSYFEALTAMAFWHFDRQDVDVAVLEVGIGGRFDATSVVDPVAAAVTSVSLEHTDIIGDSVEEIARDKASIAPEDVPLVTGATGTARDVLAAETDLVTVGPEPDESDGAPDSALAPDVVVDESPMDPPTRSQLSMRGPDWRAESVTSLLGRHQAVNAGIAAQLARQVAAVDPRAIEYGLRTVHWPGRFEVVDTDPLVVLDGAHNPDACGALAGLLDRFDVDDLGLVFGAMRDKDHAGMVHRLPDPDRVYLAAPQLARAEDVDVLATVFGRESPATTETTSSVGAALDRALRETPESGCVLVTGSLYVVAEARQRWTTSPRVLRPDDRAAAEAALASADVPEPSRRTRAGDMVARTVQLSTRHDTGRELVSAMLDLGGTGTVSGLGSGSRQVDVVLSGTLDEFRLLVRRLRGHADGGRHLATVLTDALALGPRTTTVDYPWHDQTAVMGVLDVTSDSFHDGGAFDVDAARRHAREMAAAGADIVDVAGESTRSGADPVPVDVERDRVVSVVEALGDVDALVSVDTRHHVVAEAALEAGADMVNDVTGLVDTEMRRVVAEHDVPVVAMHGLDVPVDPALCHDYDDVVDSVVGALEERLLLAERDGIDPEKILLDPGLGVGKGATESLELLDRLPELRALGHPLLVGHANGAMVADVARDPDDRVASTVAATALTAARGADVVRVHDVAANVDAVRTAEAITDRP